MRPNIKQRYEVSTELPGSQLTAKMLHSELWEETGIQASDIDVDSDFRFEEVSARPLSSTEDVTFFCDASLCRSTILLINALAASE